MPEDFRPIPDPTLLTTEALTREINHLRELHEERFRSVQKQFDERDVREERSAKDSKDAIGAALAAQKEAVGKSEESTGKQFADMRATINDVKERQTRSEGTTTGKQDLSKLLFSLMAALGVAFGIVMAFRR